MSRKSKILVVDDTPANVKLLELPDSDRAFMRAYVARATSR